MFNLNTLFRHCPVLETHTNVVTLKQHKCNVEVAHLRLSDMQLYPQKDNRVLCWTASYDEEDGCCYVGACVVDSPADIRIPRLVAQCCNDPHSIREAILYLIEDIESIYKLEKPIYTIADMTNYDLMIKPAFDSICEMHVPPLTDTMKALSLNSNYGDYNMPYLEYLGLVVGSGTEFSVSEDKDSLKQRLKLDELRLKERIVQDERRSNLVSRALYVQPTRSDRDL
jgi:hypothetical protein